VVRKYIFKSGLASFSSHALLSLVVFDLVGHVLAGSGGCIVFGFLSVLQYNFVYIERDLGQEHRGDNSKSVTKIFWLAKSNLTPSTTP
jgi:hypothetical protein